MNTYPNYKGKVPKASQTKSIIEIMAHSKDQAMGIAKNHCLSITNHMENNKADNFDFELTNIIMNGNPDNRIDVVFMGDGYTQNEKGKFYSDIQKIVKDMWEFDTFKPVLPMFNIWAVFVPSKESGLSFLKFQKNTFFNLQRQQNHLRAINPDGGFAAKRICSQLGTKCDYPSIIANDPFYGGLGGEFIIGTSSPTTGTIVLRHELGHVLAKVGEEYDGGTLYLGANKAPGNINAVPWQRWATETLKEEPLNMLVSARPFEGIEAPYTITFKSSGYQYWQVLISLSGVEDASAVEVAIDGKVLTLDSRNTLDRQFYLWQFDKSLQSGDHTLSIKQLRSPSMKDPRNGLTMDRSVCSVAIHEYKNNVFKTPNKIGAFPSFGYRGNKSLRPMNEYCVMRNMTSTKFCPLCMEAIHLNFLEKINLIDVVETSCSSGKGNAVLKALPYGQFSSKDSTGARYKINWEKDNQVLSHLQGKTAISGLLNGVYTAIVGFTTPYVRLESKYLQGKKKFEIKC